MLGMEAPGHRALHKVPVGRTRIQEDTEDGPLRDLGDRLIDIWPNC